MKTEVEINELMSKIVLYLHLPKNKTQLQRVRLLGCLESLLVLVGKIPTEGELPYKTKTTETKTWMGTRTHTEKETYKEMILRLVHEHLFKSE